MDWPRFSSTEVMVVQLWVTSALTAFLAAMAWWPDIAREIRKNQRILHAVLFLVAVVAGLNYFYASRSHQWIHRWDLFHTTMTARYFEELGYDGLYECAWVLDAEHRGHFRDVPTIRDLDTLRYVETSGLAERSDCEERFSSERREAFLRDLDFFHRLSPRTGRWRRLFRDKGYNGTPFHLALVRPLLGEGALTESRLLAVGLVDVALILVAFFVVGRAFGLTTGLVAFLFFCVNFPNRFVHMGGSALRFDYFAWLAIGLAMLRTGRYGFAGSFLGLATMTRMFPAVFVAALGGKALHESLRMHRIERRHLRFGVFFVLATAACFLFSLTVAGVAPWSEFFADLAVHANRTAHYRMGFKHMFMLTGDLTGPEGFVGNAARWAHYESLILPYWIAVAGFLAPFTFLVRKLDDTTFTALLGVLLFFLLFTATRYYYAVLALAFLLDRDLLRDRVFAFSGAMLFGISAATYVVWQFNDFTPFIYGVLSSGLLTIWFAVVIGLLCWKSRTTASEERRESAPAVPGRR